MPTSRASAVWEGKLKDGRGSFKAGSGAFSGPYTFATRFEGAKGTNPEELIAAAHAACFSMALSAGLEKLGWFDTKTPLRSGWAWGQEHLDGGVAIAEAQVGSGRLVMFGPQITFRAQPHGTFKFLFNGIVQASVKSKEQGEPPAEPRRVTESPQE